MLRDTKWSLMLVTGIALLVTPCGWGDEPPPQDAATKKYRDLVAQLVSPNQKPTTDDESVKFPKGYDVNAQQRIDAARNTLHDNIEQSLPFLIEALDDERYCMTISWAEGDAYYNESVGDICRDIIQSHLEVYRDQIIFYGPGQWNRYSYNLVSKKWFQTRKDRRLTDLQIEAINWAIERRNAEDKSNVPEDRKNEVADLQKLRERIVKDGKLTKPRGMHRMTTTDHE